MRWMRLKLTLFLTLLLPVILFAKTQSHNAIANSSDNNFMKQPAVKKFVATMVKQYHCSRNNVVNILQNAHYRAAIIERMKHPYEKKPWYVYRDFLITQDRINDGVNFWKKNHKLLKEAERKYHVPAKVIVGILGIETDFGQNLGKYHVLDALMTLTFYYPPRTKFFKEQLARFILYCKNNHIKPDSVLGSYAGAIGQAQFMPSSIANYAVAHDDSGIINLMDQEGDIIDSIANFMHKNGWNSHEPIAVYAKVTNWHKLLDYLAHHNDAIPIRDWEKHGVKPSIHINTHFKAKLLRMHLKKGYEYWFTFNNFDVILTYNHSPNYALAVTSLGTKIEHAYHSRKTHA